MTGGAVADAYRPGRKAAVRYLVGLAVGTLVLVLLLRRRGELTAIVHELRHASPGWVAAAIAAEACSLVGYAVLQHRVLRTGGARIALPSLVLLTLANDAIANTVPGEPVVSSAYRFRYYTRNGASGTAVAVWAADLGCLLCALAAVHAAIPWHGVVLAYGVAQVAGTLPVVPGGLGIIEGSLAVILTAEGAGRVPALAATLVFRAVSFWLAVAVGWMVVALLARSGRARQQ